MGYYHCKELSLQHFQKAGQDVLNDGSAKAVSVRASGFLPKHIVFNGWLRACRGQIRRLEDA
jgi:hypothetical protein